MVCNNRNFLISNTVEVIFVLLHAWHEIPSRLVKIIIIPIAVRHQTCDYKTNYATLLPSSI